MCPPADPLLRPRNPVPSGQPNSPATFDQFLRGIRAAGDPTVAVLFTELHDQLRREAHRLLAREGRGHTLQTDELVNLCYLRLNGLQGHEWADRRHFVRTAAQNMRWVLVDLARERLAHKRGAAPEFVTLTTLADPVLRLDHLIDLDRGLCKMEQAGERLQREAHVLELSFFLGLPQAEIGQLLGISETQVRRDWQHGRIWLAREVGV